MSLKQGEIVGRYYRIIDSLGEGGFATTYLAEDLGKLTKPPCVVKEIRPSEQFKPKELKKRFETEARTLELLGQHEQIPRLDKCFINDNKFYLIQEYIFGCSLNEEIIPGKKLPEEEVIKLLQEILKILQFVHENQVIHRDLKPSNLIRRVDGKIFLIDFGAVKEISTLAITKSGRIDRTIAIGTPGYIAPEQAHGNPRPNSDIYSVGIIGIQALTGLDPNNFPSDPQTNEKIWNYSVSNKGTVRVSPNLERILNKMVRYDCKYRYQSVTEVLTDLENLTKPDGIVVYNPLIKKTSFFPIWASVIAVLGAIGGLSLLISTLVTERALTNSGITQNNSRALNSRKEIVRGKSSQDRSLSEGERILDTNFITPQKERGSRLFAQGNYKEALTAWQNSWAQETKKDPETLIYLNNAFLEAENADYYTIAVVAPINSKPGTDVKNSDMAREIMRGVAQAQTEINLDLANGWEELPGGDFLPKKGLGKKGLKVVIADDVNIAQEAQLRAESLVKREDILAVIGHYSSDMTLATVDIYNDNQLVLISPGSTTEDLSKEPREYFFRTVPSIRTKAEYLAIYLISNGLKQANVFYNPESTYTRSFWEEFTRIFSEQGGTIVASNDFSQPNFNAREAIKQVGNKEKTAIILLPDDQVTHSLSNSIELIRNNQGRHWIAGGWALYSPRILQLGQLKLFDKFVISVPWHRLSSLNEEFTQDSYQLWKGFVSPRTALSYDATRAVIEALEKDNKPTRKKIKEILAEPNFVTEGATGKIQFNEYGDRFDPPVVLVEVISCPNQQYGLAFAPVDSNQCEN
ncbi:MAG: bifunctional serine/threonine-protein kinase/ABC transporter substrate-binding protein [Xenococcaceae cyanobacterium]